MTMRVRIEKADTSDHTLVVEVWARGTDGTPDRLEETKKIIFPAELAEFTVWSTRYLIVREAE